MLGVIGLVGQLLMLRAIYLRKSKRMTWTMRLININSVFALSYLILLTPIGKDLKSSLCTILIVEIARMKSLKDIKTLISADWKQGRFTCKYSMFWLYVCSGVSIISNAVLTLG